jgi:hypothetical protein
MFDLFLDVDFSNEFWLEQEKKIENGYINITKLYR